MRILTFLLLVLFAGTANAQNVYFGNLHAHTSYSDGRGIPADAYAKAREAGLDFFAVSEHNHDQADGKGDARDGIVIARRPDLYSGGPAALRQTAERLNQDGRFVAIYGQEFSTISSGNHMNVFEVPDVLRSANGRFDLLVTEMRGLRDSTGQVPFGQFNHPRIQARGDKDYGRDDFGGSDSEWVATMDPLVSLIEVLNAPALTDGTGFRADRNEAEYFRYLNLGFHVSPSAGHDNHYRNWGVSTDARVAVVAPSLTKANVLAALRAGHTYATEDKNLRIIFRANGALGGDRVAPPGPGSELRLTVQLKDDDEPAARYRIDVFQDRPGGDPASRPVETFEARGNSAAPVELEGVRFTAPGEFVLLRITQFRPDNDEDGRDDRAWTAPVWFEPAGGTPAAAAAALRIASVLPNPPGDERVNEKVTLKNVGTSPVSLSGWQIRDLAGKIWTLESGGTVQPGQEVTVMRNGQPLSLNNDGEVVELLDPSGTAVDRLEYGVAGEGQVIVPQ